MKTTVFIQSRLFLPIFCFGIIVMLSAGASSVDAADAPLRLSCSAQIHAAFGRAYYDAFKVASGIEVEVFVCSSGTAVLRLAHNAADLSGSVKRLYKRHGIYGYHEIPFASDPLVLFTNVKAGVDGLSRSQIADVFSGAADNWKTLGGPDNDVVTILPGQQCDAHWRLRSAFMGVRNLKCDFTTYQFAKAARAAQANPFVISFAPRSAVYMNPDLKVLTVEGAGPDASTYPFVQTFFFVTKGKPEGPAEAFVNFTLNAVGRKMLEKKGVRFLGGRHMHLQSCAR